MILALDLGTRTGAAWCPVEGAILSATWDFRPKRFEGAGMRYIKFRDRLHVLHHSNPVTRLYFEEVRRHAGTTAAHVYGGFKGQLEAWCEENSVPYESVPVGVIKKFWTGKGNADKGTMMAAARDRGFDPADDNEADALAILGYVLGGMK
jgi:Holliday junction resolvasome RuvABC endonuclease subunit